MYQCKNCGGNLEFDIESQRLKCKYCNSDFDPYDVTKESDGYESDMFEATYFSCPNCGGEIYSTDNAAAGFCSFCGASTVLSSRVEQELKPDGIIPFQITKEDCKKKYLSRMKKAIFAPKSMKDAKAIDSFRGIYMPYWKYQFMMNGRASVAASKSRRSGDYIYTDHYLLNGDVNAVYNGFTFDASSSFYDNISEEIAPYEVRDAKDFTPSMLSGFYADVADVPKETYSAEARKKAETHVKDTFIHLPQFSKYSLENKNDNVPLENVETNRMLFPVWFMSYRKKNQVAYVTLNGQTGKMAADIPIDIKKFMLFALILAVPIFYLLQLIPVFPQWILMAVLTMVSLTVTAASASEISEIISKMSNERDKGLNRIHPEEGVKSKVAKDGTTATIKAYNSDQSLAMNFLGIFILGFILGVFAMVFLVRHGHIGAAILYVIEIAIGIGLFKFISHQTYGFNVQGKSGVILNICSFAVAFVISVINPVSDIYYYGGAIFSGIAVFVNLTLIIVNYNKLVTRRPPQFDKRGGNDNA